MFAPAPTERRVALHRRALWLECFTVGWNVIEALVAISAGVIAASVALIGFGADSAIEVISGVGLLWRLRKAGPHAAVSEESAAEKRALYVVAVTFFLLAVYITWEAANSLISREEPLTSPVGIILAVLSLAVMPTLAFAKQRVGTDPLSGDWLTTKQAADSLGITSGTLRGYVSRGRFPPAEAYVQDVPVWRRATVERWQAERPRKRP